MGSGAKFVIGRKTRVSLLSMLPQGNNDAGHWDHIGPLLRRKREKRRCIEVVRAKVDASKGE